jgi:hypothetical protein
MSSFVAALTACGFMVAFIVTFGVVPAWMENVRRGRSSRPTASPAASPGASPSGATVTVQH